MNRHTQRHNIIDRLLPRERVRKFHGDPLHRKLRVVCGECNNGWMSRLQNRAKPILLPLILGEKAQLRRTAQTLIASWATMTAMVAEFAIPSTVTSPQSERVWFQANQVPAPNWRVWLGHYRGTELRKQW
jgi:hypothetical protein